MQTLVEELPNLDHDRATPSDDSQGGEGGGDSTDADGYALRQQGWRHTAPPGETLGNSARAQHDAWGGGDAGEPEDLPQPGKEVAGEQRNEAVTATERQLQVSEEDRHAGSGGGYPLAEGELDELSDLELAIEEVRGPGRSRNPGGLIQQAAGELRQGSLVAALKWVSGSLIVAAVMLGGLLHGSYLLRHQLIELPVPVIYGWMDFMCGLYGCQLETQDSYRVLAIEDRWLEDHPQREDTLMLGAVLAHTGNRRLPYPDIELVLRDLDGHVTQRDRAAPQDYVADSRQRTQIEEGIEPGTEVPIRLEIAAPDEGATSFLLRFHPPQ